MFDNQLLDSFAGVKVLILGDVMLDRYWWGSVHRISPEAPVPVVNLENMSLVAGGAANVAANVAGLGAEPLLVGLTGDDDEAALFETIFREKNISTDGLLKSQNRRTTIKTRIIAHNQQVVRVDQESKKSLSDEEENQLWGAIERHFEAAHIIIVSDYGKGIADEKLLARLITKASGSGKLVIVDPKGKNYRKYQGATLLTPNRLEVAEALHLDDYGQDSIESVGGQMIRDYDLQAMLITQGEAGMTLFEKDDAVTHLKVTARKVYDVTGAGDTVIGCFATAVGAGADFKTAAGFANIAAGLVVEQIGTTAISRAMLDSARQSDH